MPLQTLPTSVTISLNSWPRTGTLWETLAAMKLLDLLHPAVVKIELDALDKDECFEELIDLLVKAGQITDRQSALDAIYAREDLQTTGIGKGVAIPHGKDPAITDIRAAAATSKKGIEFESIDDKPVHLVFLVLAQVNNPGPHLQTLAEIAACLNQPGVYDRLVNAQNPDAFLAQLQLPDDGVI